MRGHYGEYRWKYNMTDIHPGIWLMGDLYGPYGHDHESVLDWAWQSWPNDVRMRHSAGSNDSVVAMVRRHVQCEMNLHHSSCVLLSNLEARPPLVFRPWLVGPEDPPWLVAIQTLHNEQPYVRVVAAPQSAPIVYAGPIVRDELSWGVNI